MNKTVKAIGLALVIAFFGGSIIALSSCDSNGDSSYNVDRLTAAQRADIEQAGILHSKALDAIITDFMRERIRVFHESANQSTELRSATAAYTCLEQVALNTTKRLMKEWELVQDEQEAQAFISELSMLNLGGTRASFETDMVRQLTPFQTEYYHRLMSIIERNDVMSELEQLLSEIRALELQIERNAPTIEEALPLLYAASVSRHSSKFWNKNHNRWLTVLYSEILEVFVSEDIEGATTRTLIGIITESTRPYWMCRDRLASTIGNYNVFFDPNPYRPDWFVMITNGRGYVMACPCGVPLWDPVRLTCVLATNSHWWCGRRRCIVGVVSATGAAAVSTRSVLVTIFSAIVAVVTFC